jgi:hypothetical protein
MVMVGGRGEEIFCAVIWIQQSCSVTQNNISSWIPNVRKEDMNGALNIYPIPGGINGAH